MSDIITVRVEHHFKTATAEQVFDAWTDPAKIRAWNEIALKDFGMPADITTIEVDVREGGAFLFADIRDGEETRCWGTYMTVERPRVLEFTWFATAEEEREAHSIVRIEITPKESGCSAALTHEMDAIYAEYEEQTQRGWSTTLAAIDNLTR